LKAWLRNACLFTLPAVAPASLQVDAQGNRLFSDQLAAEKNPLLRIF